MNQVLTKKTFQMLGKGESNAELRGHINPLGNDNPSIR